MLVPSVGRLDASKKVNIRTTESKIIFGNLRCGDCYIKEAPQQGGLKKIYGGHTATRFNKIV